MTAPVDLRFGVVGNLPLSAFNNGQNAGANTFWRGDGTWASTLGPTPTPTPTPSNGSRTQRSVTSNTSITFTDQILNINAALDLGITVPLASTRSGLPLTFKCLPSSHSQTINATSPDTFDGTISYTLAPGAYLTLVPYNDGVNSGYAVE